MARSAPHKKKLDVYLRVYVPPRTAVYSRVQPGVALGVPPCTAGQVYRAVYRLVYRRVYHRVYRRVQCRVHRRVCSRV